MAILKTILTVVFILICLALTVIILLQEGKSAGLGAIAGAEDVAYKIKSASGEAVVNKDGYFSSMKIKMLMDMEVQGETISIDMDTDAVYRNPGQEVTLAAPSLDGYQEVDPAAMGVQQ